MRVQGERRELYGQQTVAGTKVRQAEPTVCPADKAPVCPADQWAGNGTGKSRIEDQGALPRLDTQQEIWRKSLEECLAQMASTYPQVKVTVGEFTEEELSAMAAAWGDEAHLVVSTSFLERMAASASSYEKGKALLETLLSTLSSGVPGGKGCALTAEEAVFWVTSNPQEEDIPTLWERQAQDDQRLITMMENLKKEGEKQKNKFKVKVNPASYSASGAMAQLAKARTVTDVKTVIASARRSISSLKMAMSLSTEKERNKLRAAISSMEKVTARGGKKIRDLTEEGGLQNRQKKAQQEQLLRKAARLKQELRQRRTARFSREQAQIQEVKDKESMDALQQELERQLEQQLEALTQEGESQGGALTGAPGDSLSGEVSPSATGSVQFSPPVAITL